MPPALERKLIVVTGKGGVGKTTVSAAIGLLAARRGLRTIVVEVTGATRPFGPDAADTAVLGRLAALMGRGEPTPHGVEVELRENLWALSIDRDRVLAEWLRALGGRVPARVLTSSSSFQYLIAAAPGAREMLSMVKVWELAQGRRPLERDTGDGDGGPEDGAYDLVVLDAPATGHALAMLRSPQMFSAIARVGPIARQARQVRELFEDPARSGYVAVAQGTEMAITETLELRRDLRRELERELYAVVINGALPRRFAGAELERVAALDGHAPHEHAVLAAAARCATAAHTRARAQQSQIARLRRALDGATRIARLPYLFTAELDRKDLQLLAGRLEREL